MSKNCQHVYIAGPKKGNTCNRFIRKSTTQLEANLCYQHKLKNMVVKPKEVKEIEKQEVITEVKIEEKEEEKPVKVHKCIELKCSTSSESSSSDDFSTESSTFSYSSD